MLCAISLFGQEVEKIKVDVKVVNVLATVRDKHGAIVNTLGKDDFSIEEDGRPQTVKYFARESDLPLTLGLLVDTSMSQRRSIDQERTTSAAFLDQMLRDKDKAFLIHFDREVELLQDLTPSKQKLRSALDQLQAASYSTQVRDPDGGQRGDPDDRGQSGGGYPGSRGGSHRHAGTMLYDSVFLASDELMSKQQGRKAVIVLSDGVDHGSKTSIERAIESAQRADTVVYAIYFQGEENFGGGYGGGQGGGHHGGLGGPTMGGPFPGGSGPMGGGRRGGGQGPGGYPREEHTDGKKILQRIAHETGGRMFEVSKKQTVEQIYQQIQDELRHQYNLGYTPDRADSSGEYHRIVLKAKQSDLNVQAREGYYALQ